MTTYLHLTKEQIEILLKEGLISVPDPEKPEGDNIVIELEEDD
jgi:hypothetical protein